MRPVNAHMACCLSYETTSEITSSCLRTRYTVMQDNYIYELSVYAEMFGEKTFVEF